MDSRFLVASDSLIGLAKLNELSVDLAGVAPEAGLVHWGRLMSKRGRLEMGRAMVGRLRGSTVS